MRGQPAGGMRRPDSEAEQQSELDQDAKGHQRPGDVQEPGDDLSVGIVSGSHLSPVSARGVTQTVTRQTKSVMRASQNCGRYA